jgi:diguanylate cyclase (GGDEF)-like protein
MQKYLNEHYINKKIINMTIFTVLLSLLLILSSSLIIFTLQKANSKSFYINLKSVINEYKINLENQFNSDFQSLEVLSSFISNNDLISFTDTENVSQYNDTKNEFERISYFPINGNSSRLIFPEKLETNIDIDSLNSELKAVIKSAWSGKHEISEVYYDDDLNLNIIVYAIPIYNEDKNIIGCLTGSKKLDIFSDILNQKTMSNYILDVDWINSNGEFITWSKQSIIEERINSIYSGSYISDNEKLKIKEKINYRDSYKSKLTYKNKTYPLYVEPLDVNNWNLIYIDKFNSIKSPVYALIYIASITFILITIIIILAIILVYRMLLKHNKDLIKLAYYDKLTGCYNFEKFRYEALKLFSKNTNYSIATLNIRNFQYINEIIGHHDSDSLLIEFANILKSSINSKEIFCRYSADQFYLLINDTNKISIKNRLLNIMNNICNSISDINIKYPLRLYSGIAINDSSSGFTDITKDLPTDLIHKAEFAQKHIQKTYINILNFYDKEMHESENFNNSIESSMEAALKNNEFKLFLQPKTNLKTDKIQGAEALVRWVTNEGRVIFPSEFINLFENNGFCVNLDLYMFEKVCQKIRYWIDSKIEPITISINQSKLLFYRTDYVEKLLQIMSKYNIPKELIILEVLEGMAIENIDEFNKTIKNLHANGFKISMDDFGSGYSSLNVLASIEIDEIKFDRNFLNEKSPDKKNKLECTLRNMMNLAKDLNISTVVEGVETEEDELLIKRMGCNYGQGYYYSKPISSSEFDLKFMHKN